MANLIKLRRSAVQGAVPTTAQLELGELAINTYDGKLFLKRDDGLAQYIVEVGGNVGFEVKNQTGSTIPKGTVVKFAGTLGASGRLLVSPFLANGTDPSEYVVGIVEHDIPDGSDGFAIDHGKIFNLNTSAFSQGAILYASSTVAGGLTATPPAAPNNKVTIAAVVHSSATVGILEVRLTLGSSLDNDELVQLGTLADGDTLVWNATNGRFENEQPSGGSPGGSNTQIQFNDSGVFGGATNFVFDKATGNVGAGTSSPGYRFDVASGDTTASIGYAMRIRSNATATAAAVQFTNSGASAQNGLVACTDAGALTIQSDGASSLLAFRTNGNERMRITNAGNVGIGTSNPLTQLDVATSGGSRVRTDTSNSSLVTQFITNAAATAYITSRTDASDYQIYTAGVEKVRIDQSGNVGIGTSAPTARLDVLGDFVARTDASGGNTPLNVKNDSTANNTTKTTALRFQGTDTVGTGKNTGLVQCGPVDSNYVASYLAFQTRTADTLTERMRITDTGNVGIGTSAPDAKLDVSSSSQNIVVSRSTGGYAAFQRSAPSGQQAYDFYTVNGVEAGRITVDGSNFMAFSTGSAATERFRITSTGAITSSDLADAVGYKGIPQNSQTSAYTLALSDIGKHISITTGGVVIPANSTVAFPISTTIVIFNDSASTQTLSITTDTLRQSGTTNTGTITIKAYGVVTIMKVASTVWVGSGDIA